MKKVFIFMMLTTSIFYLGGFNKKVNAKPRAYAPRNILDLSNLEGKGSNPYSYKTINPMVVESGATYQFVFSKDFFGSGGSSHSVHILDGTLQVELDLNSVGNQFYYEYTMINNSLSIEQVYIMGMNSYEAMIYKGDILINNFIPYSEEADYYIGDLNIDYDDNVTLETINSYISAINPTDQTNLNTVVESSNYTNEVGSYLNLYYVKHNNIYLRYYLNIHVEDRAAPVINTNLLTYKFSEKPLASNILSDINISDNVNKRSDITLEVTDDLYSTASKPGAYSLTVLAKDKSGNSSTKKIDINLSDDISPVIIGPNSLYTYETKIPITNNDILNKMSYSDDVSIESNISRVITSNNYNQTKTPGKYTVTIEATDEKGNKSNKVVTIHVIANQMAEFVLDISITTRTNVLLTSENILKKFTDKAKLLGVEVKNPILNKDIYDLNANKPGKYTAFIEYELEGDILYSEVDIIVNQKETNKLLFLLIIPAVAIITLPIYIYKKRK